MSLSYDVAFVLRSDCIMLNRIKMTCNLVVQFTHALCIQRGLYFIYDSTLFNKD